MMLALVGALLGWRGVVVSLFGGSLIGTVIALVVFAVARRRAPTPTEESDAEPASIMRTELPFGPFLAMAALLYLFAEPWIELHFRLPGW